MTGLWLSLSLSGGCTIVIFFLFELEFSNGNYEAVLCEEEMSLNISCDDDYVIKIKDVEFWPPDSLNNSLFDNEMQQINGTYLHALCDDRQVCVIKNTGNNNVEGYTDVPRLANISYKCDFEYIGCYKDDKGLLSRNNANSMSNTEKMSAFVCRHYCLEKGIHLTHFGTKDSAHCYCGYASLIQLNKTTGSNLWYNSSECKASCLANEDETCGAKDLISIYTSEAETRHVLTPVNKVPLHKCDFNSTYTNLTVMSLEVSKYCEKHNLTDPSRLRCNGNHCFLDLSMPYVLGTLSNHLPYYMKISYMCNDKEKHMHVENNVTVVVGVVIGACFIFSVIFGLFILKRRLKRNGSSEKVSFSQETGLRNMEYVDLQLHGNTLYNNSSSENNEYTVLKTTLSQDNPDGDYEYTGSVECVANKPKFKDKSKPDVTIHNHTSDKVHNSAIKNEPNFKEEIDYDQNVYQAEGKYCNA